jgi:hypothetical protein
MKQPLMNQMNPVTYVIWWAGSNGQPLFMSGLSIRQPVTGVEDCEICIHDVRFRMRTWTTRSLGMNRGPLETNSLLGFRAAAMID